MSRRRKFAISHDEFSREFSPIDLRKTAAEVWAAGVAAGAAVYSADQQGKAADQAAAGSERARQLTQQQYEQARIDQQPYMRAGQRAVNQLDDLNSGDYSSFTESPDYQFARDQGIKSIDRSAASRGTQYSGGQLAALADYSSGLASQNYNQYYNRIANLANLGQNAASGVGQQGQQYAQTGGNAIQNAGYAQAAGTYGQASTYANLGDKIGDAFGRWYQGQNSYDEGPPSYNK